MRVVILADRDPYLGYGRPELSIDGSGLLVSVQRPASPPPPLPPGTDLLVLPASCLLAESWTRPEPAFMAYGPERLIAASFAAGARDFLREPWGLIELEARASRLGGPRRLSFPDGEVLLEGRRLSGPSGSRLLSESERSLLDLLLTANGEPLPRILLGSSLGLPDGPGSRALDVRVSALRKSLSSVGIPGDECILSSRGKGYRCTLVACG